MLSIMLSALDSQNDRDFIRKLYKEYEGLLFSTALKIAPPTFHDAEEIVQESLANLIRKVTTLARRNVTP